VALEPEIAEKIRALPKVELHRHLEGCISAELLLEIAKDYQVELPANDLEGLRSLIQVKGQAGNLKEFLEKFYFLGKAFPTLEAVERVSYCVCRDCARDNIRCLELRFSPVFMSLETPHGWDDLLQAVLRGSRRAEKEFPIEVGFIVGISRSNPLRQALRAVEVAERYAGLGVVGLDLFGDEATYPPELFTTAFKVAQASGLNITVHAGEGGAETNIRIAVEQLGASRIGHGVKIINDEKMMEWLREKGIPLEICLTSNVKTRTVASLDEHPVRKLYDSGIRISLNTDDPALCDTTLSQEYMLAMDHFQFNLPELKALILDSLEQSFLEDYRKRNLKALLEKELSAV
jgi:adenosine deaminase